MALEEDKLNFLDEEPEADDAEQAPEEAAPESAEEPEASEAEETPEEGTGETESEPPSDEKESHRSIPVTALLDEREKRQKAERELDELRKWREEQQRKEQSEQGQKPDFYEAPEQAVQQQVLASTLRQSRFLAEREFGEDVVKEAYDYFDQHPDESRDLLKHPSPFHAAVEKFKQRKFLDEVKDPDAWREQERKRIREELQAEIEKGQPSRPKAPPPSMATAPSTGGDAITPGTAFDEAIPE